jgi:hypothetical protein
MWVKVVIGVTKVERTMITRYWWMRRGVEA